MNLSWYGQVHRMTPNKGPEKVRNWIPRKEEAEEKEDQRAVGGGNREGDDGQRLERLRLK